MTVRYAAFTTSALPLAIATGQSALATGVCTENSIRVDHVSEIAKPQRR